MRHNKTRQQFLKELKPHHEHLLFYKGLSKWPKGWSGNDV